METLKSQKRVWESSLRNTFQSMKLKKTFGKNSDKDFAAFEPHVLGYVITFILISISIQEILIMLLEMLFVYIGRIN